MGLFSRKPVQEAAPPAGETQVAKARESIVADLAGRLDDPSRAAQVRALPGGEEMVAEAVRRAAQG